MSDKDRLIALLNDFGVEFKEGENVRNGETLTTIRCEQGMEKVSGYGGFVTQFEFTKAGAFVSMGAWE